MSRVVLTKRELPDVGSRVAVRVQRRLLRGDQIVEGYDHECGEDLVWLRHVDRAAGHPYRLREVRFEPPRRRQ